MNDSWMQLLLGDICSLSIYTMYITRTMWGMKIFLWVRKREREKIRGIFSISSQWRVQVLRSGGSVLKRRCCWALLVVVSDQQPCCIVAGCEKDGERFLDHGRVCCWFEQDYEFGETLFLLSWNLHSLKMPMFPSSSFFFSSRAADVICAQDLFCSRGDPW